MPRTKVNREQLLSAHAMGVDACGAFIKKAKKHCDRPAGFGTDHEGIGPCRLHGGNLPAHIRGNVIANAELSILVEEPVHIEPGEALLWCVTLASQDVRWINDRIAHLERYEIRPTSTKRGQERGETTDIRERGPVQLHGYIQLRFQAEERLARFAKMAMDAGVAERMVRLAERMGEMIAPLLDGLMEDMGIDKDDARPFIEKRLKTIEGQARLVA